MAGKWILNTASMQEDFFSDAALIAIVSPVPAYQFCGMINQYFDTQFTRDFEHDIKMQVTKEKEQYFAVYQFAMPLNGPRYILYKLKSEKQNLLPEAKGIDYLWMIHSTNPESQAEQIAGFLRQMPDVQLAQTIAPGKLKNRDHLVM